MTTDKEVMQMALDCIVSNQVPAAANVKEALRAALAQTEKTNQCGETCERAKLCAVCARGLAQPEPEPVAWTEREPVATVYDAYDTTGIDWHCKDAPATGTKLYTAPPQREWQRDGEKLSKELKMLSDNAIFGASGKTINTDSAAYQELMAFIDEVAMGVDSPPSLQREWQGLTDEEIKVVGKLNVEGERMLPYSFARAIEQALKEKNT